MSLHNPTYDAAARAYEEAPDDGPDYLADKPKGWCPSCGAYVYDLPGGGSDHAKLVTKCDFWDYADTEDDNRLRYAAEREAEAKLEERIAKEARRSWREDI